MFGVFRVKNHDFTPKNHIIPSPLLDPPLSSIEDITSVYMTEDRGSIPCCGYQMLRKLKIICWYM